MQFGQQSDFAIEVGDITRYKDRLYCHFRIWIESVPYGDWESNVSLLSSIVNTHSFCAYEATRVDHSFQNMKPEDIFIHVYDSYYMADYSLCDISTSNLRKHYHLEYIGIDSLMDRCGIVLASPSFHESRLIIKDWVRNGLITEYRLPFGQVERTALQYVEWGVAVLIAAGCVAQDGSWYGQPVGTPNLPVQS